MSLAPRQRALLLGLIALGGVLRFATLDVQSYWNDEVVTANLLHQSFGDAIAQVPTSESTPPLYYALAWFWTQAFGLGEVGLRSFSALLGTLTIPAAFMLGARLASVRAGLASAALVALNPLLWWYSQEGRAYALLVLLCTLATVAFLDARGGRTRGLILWALASSLALTSHYYAAFLVGPQAAWLLLQGIRTGRPSLRATASACSAVAAVALAALWLALRQVENGGPEFINQSGSLAYRAAQVPKQFLIGFDAPAETVATVVCVLLMLWGVACLLTRGDARARQGASIAAVLAAGAILLPVAAAVVGPDYVLARNLLPGLVPALAVAGIGFAVPSGGRFGLLAVGAMCAVWLVSIVAVTTNTRYQREDWRGVAEALGPPAGPRAIVVTPAAGEGPLRWYLPNSQGIGSATVDEMDVVAMARRRPGKSPRPERGPAPVPLGFKTVQRLDAPTFTLLRYRAEPPVEASYQTGNAVRIGQADSFVMYQEPMPHE